ncbi:MAG: hypothetical protein IAG13_39160 [Deltaproteobacteria bacterium]|nr:hypothetical protein [Nannocystaceae bacterium]
MTHPRASSPGLSFVAAALSLTLVGCQDTDEGVYIAATLLGDQEEAAAYGGHLLVRAVPDHADGFAPGRKYFGPREFADQCPIDHVELPLDFALWGSDDPLHGAPRRWRLLAWITDDTDAIWPAAGELYGTQSFEYWHDPYYGYIADGIEIELTEVVPE